MAFIKKNLNLLANGAAALFSLLALICMAGSGITYKVSKSGSTYKSTTNVFNVMTHGGNDGAEFGLILALIFVIMLILAAAALIILPLVGKDLPFLKWVALACAGVAFITFILFLSTKAMYVGYCVRNAGGLIERSDFKEYHLGGGAFFAAVFSFLAAGCFALPTIFGKVEKIEKM